MAYDNQADTRALRECSPYRSNSIAVTGVVGAVFAAMFVGIAVFQKQAEGNTMAWYPFVIALGCVVISVLLILMLSWKAKRLIEFGKIVEAEVTDVDRITSFFYRVHVAYRYCGKTYERAINTNPAMCGTLEAVGVCRVVFLPDSPKVMAPVYEFGRLRDMQKIAAGTIGLAESR